MIILIECKDQIGLVTTITRIIASHKLNIVSMREFVEEQLQLFFARIECNGDLSQTEILMAELKANLPPSSKIKLSIAEEKSIAVLVTKEFHCLAEILIKNQFKTLGAQVKCVIGTQETLREISEQFGLPFFCITPDAIDKSDFEQQISEVLTTYQPDFIVLAKFMRILSADFVNTFRNKVINIHHSFLPAFIGANPYRQAFERGVKIIGATAHFVTNHLDEGPIIAQQTIHVNHTFGVKEMVIAGRGVEKSVLMQALDIVLQDRVFISGNKTVVFE